jgi:hypothetical protein
MVLQKQFFSHPSIVNFALLMAVAALLLLCATSPALAAKFEIIGQVEKLEGEVYATRDDIDKKQPLNAGDRIFSEDTILTGADGKVELKFLDDSTLSLGGDAQMRLDKFVYDPQGDSAESSYTVTQGFFRFVSGGIAKKKPGEMKIDTPVATMGIRGTTGGGNVPPSGGGKFFLENNADGTTGSFDVTSGGETVTMNTPGTVTEVNSPSSPPSRPTPVSRASFKQQFGQLDSFSSNGQYDSRTNEQLGKEVPDRPGFAEDVPEVEPEEPATEPEKQVEAEEKREAPVEQDKPQQEKPEAATDSEKTPEAQESAAEPTGQEGPGQSTKPANQENSETETKPVAEPKPFEPEQSREVNPNMPADYQEIQANPESVLKKFPEGGPKMAKYVAEAVQQFPDMAGSFAEAAASATPQQAAAMGVGVSRAARALDATNPDAAQRVTREMGRTPNPRMRLSYNAVGPSHLTTLPAVEPSSLPSGGQASSAQGRRSLPAKNVPQKFSTRSINLPKNSRAFNQLNEAQARRPRIITPVETQGAGKAGNPSRPAGVGAMEGPTSSPFASGGILSTAGASAVFVASEAAEEEATPTSPAK